MDESQLFKLKDIKNFFTTLIKLSNKTVLITLVSSIPFIISIIYYRTFR